MMDDSKGRWTEKLISVMWAYQTTLKRSTSKIPFSMTYEPEGVIPIEIGLPTSQTNQFDTKENDRVLTEHLDVVEENREIVSMELASYQQKITGYNKNVRKGSW